MNAFDSQFLNDLLPPMAIRLDVLRSDAPILGAVHHRGKT